MPKIIPSAKGIRSSNRHSSFYIHQESVTQFPQSKWSLRKMTIETCFVSEKVTILPFARRSVDRGRDVISIFIKRMKHYTKINHCY